MQKRVEQWLTTQGKEEDRTVEVRGRGGREKKKGHKFKNKVKDN